MCIAEPADATNRLLLNDLELSSKSFKCAEGEENNILVQFY